jgi:putative sporulation protein YyaC
MLLKKKINIDVYGTLDKPVHALNLNEYARRIKSMNYENILAIDACLSSKKNQGLLEVRNEPITPGKGIGKNLPDIGNFSIIGIVDSSDRNFCDLVQETRLSFIYEMSEVICEGVVNATSMNEVKYKKLISDKVIFGNA